MTTKNDTEFKQCQYVLTNTDLFQGHRVHLIFDYYLNYAYVSILEIVHLKLKEKKPNCDWKYYIVNVVWKSIEK